MNKFKDNIQGDIGNSYQKSGFNVDKNKILNKAPSERQITAEQILREAYEHRTDELKSLVYKITSKEELEEYQLRKRVEFEENLRRQPHSINCWLRYAKWEETQKEWERVRSIFERALNVDYRNRSVWLKYTEFEMKNSFPNHARNVWDRAVQLLPRTDQFWYKYALMEERLGNRDKSRAIFERWMKWNPPASAWESYIKLEMRCGGDRNVKISRARKIWRRFSEAQDDTESYLKWAAFETKFGEIHHAREVFTLALKRLGEQAYNVNFFKAFAGFEMKAKETERARAIYKFALDNVPREKAAELFEAYSSFEKQSGGRGDIESLIMSKKRFEFEEKIKAEPKNYNIWFDYLKMEEQNNDIERATELFERAIAELPPADEKALWSRYIYLWIRYAIFTELGAKNYERTREIYRACLKLIPHKNFTFAKIWLMAAEFEIRRLDIKAARKILGEAIGKCPKPRLFKGYIEIETKLLEMDRCRKLYEKFLEQSPENCEAWHSYAEMEAALGETERSRAIYDLGVDQEVLDMPEKLWTKYIDFETGSGNKKAVVGLYERLLERTKNVKVWMSFAETMAHFGDMEKARAVYSEADRNFKNEGIGGGAARNELLQSWLEMEKRAGNGEMAEELEARLPREVRRKRADGGEFVEFVFPDATDSRAAHMRLLSIAQHWKKAKTLN